MLIAALGKTKQQIKMHGVRCKLIQSLNEKPCVCKCAINAMRL